MKFLARTFGLLLTISGFDLSQPCLVDAAQNAKPPLQENSKTGQTFKIAGTVVSSTTGAPLSQTRISVADTRDREKVASMITTEDGHFEFSQLKPGKYSLRGAKHGFLSAAYDQHEQFSTAIVTGAEFSTEHLVLRLTPAALITGHVLDEFGDPVRSAHVLLYFEAHMEGMSRVISFSSSSSDDRGFYDFSLLPPGKYYVSVIAEPWYAMHPVTASIPAANPAQHIPLSLDVAYPTTFYNGATESDRATPIDVKGGDRLQVDLHLIPVPALHVLFRVPEDQVNNFRLPMLQRHVFDSVQFVQTERANQVAHGVYELTGLPPGRYSARMKNSNSGQLEQSTDLDLIHDGQELNASQGEPLGTLKLTLKMPGQETFPKQYGIGLQDSRRRFAAFKQGDLSGQVSFEDLPPGTYAIFIFSGPKPYSVVRTSSQASDFPGHDVIVTPGAALELTASLAVGKVSIEGAVQKKDKPMAGVMVALVPKDPEAHIELFRRDQSDFDGTFVLRGVIPGSYTIVAVEDAWGFDWQQPGILTRYVQHGQNLIIGERMQGTVHLPDPVEVQPH